ncbi:uncharacterized protein FTOL_13582 [Fusarium torulosum]|uniref:Zn(2)-C6 fungal-type domain-containing protein n=1 Tax=Fusarium torulosum TaxID=33205 RepID=A0AAE8MM08_9HYPO|nr:uncharacterized protein FTOL_13582 [Fusarium torulosum]
MRNNGSCWICRARHKKCDETHPACQNCTTLGLSCLYGDRKPEWMDNGQVQRQMCQRLKAQVKRNARNRRGRQMIDKITQDLNDTYLPPSQATVDASSPALNGCPVPLATSTSELADGTTPPSWSHDIDSLDSLDPSQQANSGESETNSTQDLSQPNASRKFLFGTSFRETLKVDLYGEEDLRFIMSYKDYVFPLLYPFYHPSFFEGGHNWLLVSAMRNTESRQLIVSLATYFFSLVPIFPGAGFQLCSTFTWAEVQTQSEQAFRGMQHRVEILGQQGVASNLWETTHLFGNIMLLLEFETMTQYSQVWGIHLDAAIILFKQILASPQLESFVWRVPFNPASMSSQEASQLTPTGAHLFSSTQVAFRFFAAKIIIADIISSVALEQTPRLQNYYERLMGGQEDTNLCLKDVTGCDTWVYISIAEIIELDVWKKQAKTSGNFSFMTFVQRAGKIIERLGLGLAGLSEDADATQDNHEFLQLYYPYLG